MKMFPHAFVASQGAPTPGEQFKIDVESAVELMLTASAERSEGLRQQFRRKVLETLPPGSIDWDSVDWVQLDPFKSSRT